MFIIPATQKLKQEDLKAGMCLGVLWVCVKDVIHSPETSQGHQLTIPRGRQLWKQGDSGQVL